MTEISEPLGSQGEQLPSKCTPCSAGNLQDSLAIPAAHFPCPVLPHKQLQTKIGLNSKTKHHNVP